MEWNDKKVFSRIGFSYLALLVLTLVFRVLEGLIIRSLGVTMPTWLALIINMLPLYLIGAPACMMIMKKIPVASEQPKVKWGIGKLLLYFMVALGMMYLGNIFSQIIVALFNRLLHNPMTNPLSDMVLNQNVLVNILIMVILAPIVEELLFRKLLIDRIRVYGEGIAVFVSGALFGLFHGNLYQVFYAFILGVVFAYVYVKTRQIKYCIGFHMVINLLGGVLIPLLIQKIDLAAIQSGDVNQMMAAAPQLLLLAGYAVVMIGCMIASVVVLICLRKRITFAPGEFVIEKNARFQTIFLNVGMILFLLGCLYLFIVNAR